jgi:hypothetical protein
MRHARCVNTFLLIPGLCLLCGLTASVLGASVGPRFYGDPPDDHHPWAVHDGNRPQPVRLTPGTFSQPDRPGRPPSDARILFDGKDLSGWQNDKGAPAPWVVQDGVMTVVPGTGQILSREQFGDCQLHLEWAAPSKVEGDGQGRANSGVFLMGMLEIQILDSYDNVTYADGHAGAYYGINPPLALPIRPPGEWQVYDIVFRRPIYRGGQVLDPGYVTVFVNGVLVQDHTPLEGSGTHMTRTKPGPFPEKGPLSLQDHGNPMRFRNIWYRPLPPRPAEGGTDGWLTQEATTAKRKEIAASLRADAASLVNASNPVPEMLRLMESLVYEVDAPTARKAGQMAAAYFDKLQGKSAAQLAPMKDEVKQLRDVFNYLVRFGRLPEDFAPRAAAERMIQEQGWDKKQR